MFTTEWEKKDCTHEKCTCSLTVKGKVPEVSTYSFTTTNVNKDLQVGEVLADLTSQLQLIGGCISVSPSICSEEQYLRSKIGGMNMTVIPAPMRGTQYPEPLCRVDPPVPMKRILQKVDRIMIPRTFPGLRPKDVDWEELWRPKEVGEIPSLRTSILEKHSAYCMAYGLINGKPQVVSSQADLYPFKMSDTILGYQKPVHKLKEAAADVLKFAGEAMQYMYREMGIDSFQNEASVMDFRALISSYMGSSSGVIPGPRKTVTTDTFDLSISPGKKKIESLESDLDLIIDYLENDVEFQVTTKCSPKNEYKFSNEKQYSAVDYAAWSRKMRIFMIPDSTFVVAEKLISKMRMLKERGNMIRIGSKWVYGGAWALALALGLSKEDLEKLILVEGDVKNFDQTVHEIFVRWYMMLMLLHEDPKSPDYAAKKKLAEFVAKNMSVRMVRLFAEFWVMLVGGVGSGWFNTSHMDSWVMAMYLWLFAVYTLYNSDEKDRDELAIFLCERFRKATYGDDHLYVKGMTRISHYLSGHKFAAFMKKFFDVEVRDIFDGIPFVSQVVGGRMSSRGACFLRHFFVWNPAYTEENGQAPVIPWRSTWEFIIRAVWGREVKTRDLFDVLLSVIGHAYGTFGSNREAYDMLNIIYSEIVEELQIEHGSVLIEVTNRVTSLEIKKLRQLRLTATDILRGFPTFDELVSRNVYKPEVHENQVLDFDVAYDQYDISEWDY